MTRIVAAYLAIALTILAPDHCTGAPSLDLREHGWIGVAVAEYIEAFNARDEAGLEHFVKTYRDQTSLTRTPAEARVQRQLQMQGMLGAIEVVSISKAEATELRMIVHAATMDGYFEVFFEESESEPGKIGSMGMLPAAPPDQDQVHVERLETLQAVVDRLKESSAVPALAAAFVDRDGKIVVATSGLRSVTDDEAITPEDRFHLGSLTKSMTASIAARLVAQGTIEFDRNLASVFDDIDMDPAYASVTLADLLHHRGGIEALTSGEPERERAWKATSDEASGQRLALAKDVLARAPSITPRTAMQYSNAGYAIAAVMLERAAERSWEQLIDEQVFEVLELESAHLGWPWRELGPVARGHWVRGGVRLLQADEGYDLDGPIAPAGNVSMSVSDLARYGRAHLQALEGSSEWLDPEIAAILHRPAVEGDDTGYAMGWSVERIGDRILHLHAGSAGTYYAVLAIDPESGIAIAVTCNDGDLANDATARQIIAWVLDRD